MIIASLVLIVGLGTCTSGGDWCAKPTGKLAAYQYLYRTKRHEIGVGVDHFSRFGDGELKGKGDRGLEIFSIQYKLKIGE